MLFSNTNYQKRVEYTSLISVIPPLDLAYCAALAREKIPSLQVSCLDANVLGLSDEEHIRQVRFFKPDVLVLTAATYAINGAKTLVEALDDKIKVVLIGTHGSALPEETMACIKGIDVIVRGEPEWTTCRVLQALSGNKPLSEINGICFRQNGKVESTPDDSMIADLDALPFPARDILPNHLYSSPYSDRVTALRTTRGCPGRCNFCDSHLLFGRRTRMRNPKFIVDEIEACARLHGTDYFAIIDHTFTADRNFVIAFCEETIRRGLSRKIRWVCNTRVDMLSDEMLTLMGKAGCLQIGIGMESAVNKQLKAVKKGVTEQQIRDAIVRIKSHGILAMGYSIIGFPEDTAESIEETRDKIFQMNPHTLQLSFATPLPGSKLRERCIKEDRILSDNWDDYVFLRKSIIRNDQLSTEELTQKHNQIVRSFYFRPKKFFELLLFVLLKARVNYVSVARAFLKILRNLGK